MHLNSLLIFREHVLPRIPPDAEVLEIGPDGDPSLFCRELGVPPGWRTADLAAEAGTWSRDHAKAQILMPSEYDIPVPDATFDVVFSAQVAEHVREIWRWMREVARVTRPGGLVVTISPVSWPYHEAPVDCWRMYPEAMAALSEHAGLVVEHSWWGTLEPPPSARTYPGRGNDWASLGRRLPRLKRLIGWPAPVAVDLVTVARKPATDQPA